MPRKRKDLKGEGWFDVAKSIGKVVAPIAIDEGAKALKNYAGSGIKTRKMGKKGEGWLDTLKSVGKVVAPIAIDAGSNALKNYIGSGFPIGLSRPQYRTLSQGGAITIKPDMIHEAGEHLLQLLPQRAKKLVSSLGKNKGMRIALQHGEDLIHRASGGSIWDIAKSVGKVLAPVAIDAGSQALKNYVGSGTKKGMARKTARKAYEGRGASPYVSQAYKEAMGDMNDIQGGSLFGDIGRALAPVAIDAGSQALKHYVGSGIHGVRQSALVGRDLDMPIQLGSPYQHIGSPAMNPFIPVRGIQSADPIPKIGQGIVPAGTGFNPAGTGIYPAGTMVGRGRKRGKGAVGSTIGSVLGSFLPF
jgi:hypothetical protein